MFFLWFFLFLFWSFTFGPHAVGCQWVARAVLGRRPAHSAQWQTWWNRSTARGLAAWHLHIQHKRYPRSYSRTVHWILRHEKKNGHTCSPDARGRGRRPAVNGFVPLSKEPMDHMPLLIRDGSFHLVHTWVPSRLWQKKKNIHQSEGHNLEQLITLYHPGPQDNVFFRSLPSLLLPVRCIKWEVRMNKSPFFSSNHLPQGGPLKWEQLTFSAQRKLPYIKRQKWSRGLPSCMQVRNIDCAQRSMSN